MFGQSRSRWIDPLSYRVEGLPAGAIFNAQTGLFTWTPNYFTAGEYDITFTATDGNAEARETVHLVVENANQAPVLLYMPRQNVNEGRTLGFRLLGADRSGN